MKYKVKHSQPLYRFERKFLVTGLNTDEIEALVNINSLMFNYSYQRRTINNIYFDDFNFSNYHANVEGATDRIKIRIRWYGEPFDAHQNPKLEIKIKKGLLGSKETLKLKGFNLNEDLSDLFRPLENSYIYKRYSLDSVSPVLLNSYSRSYYISNDKSYRITIDDCQSYFKIGKRDNSFLHKVDDRHSKILEIKYNDEFDDNVNYITNNLPFRMTKNSKYVNGIDSIYSY